MIEGMPESVSAVSLMTVTNLLPRFAYSTRYMAQPMPIGTAKSRESAVIYIVFMIDGSIDWFSSVYLSENIS